jgi:hypothetical protein
MLQVWQDDWLKWLLSKSSDDGGTKTPADGQHNRLIQALDSIPDPMERWVKLRNDIMIPQKKNHPVKNQEHFRDKFNDFYNKGNPFEGLTADPASSHMDTEEFFNAAFQNSPAVRRAYEDALTQGVPLADHISDAIKFILNMASTALKMSYEGVGDSIETALSMLFRANHLYQKLERGLKFAYKWINFRTFVFRTSAILAVCFLFFRQKTIAFLKYFDRKRRAWTPDVIKATKLPIKIGKAVAFAAYHEIKWTK